MTKFAANLKLMTFDRVGQYVVNEGDPVNNIVVILSGALKLSKETFMVLMIN